MNAPLNVHMIIHKDLNVFHLNFPMNVHTIFSINVHINFHMNDYIIVHINVQSVNRSKLIRVI